MRTEKLNLDVLYSQLYCPFFFQYQILELRHLAAFFFFDSKQTFIETKKHCDRIPRTRSPRKKLENSTDGVFEKSIVDY